MDISVLPFFRGTSYLLMLVDRFSRGPETLPLIDISAQTFPEAFFDGWVSRFGISETSTSDRGGQLESALWCLLMHRLGMHHVRTHMRNLCAIHHTRLSGLRTSTRTAGPDQSCLCGTMWYGVCCSRPTTASLLREKFFALSIDGTPTTVSIDRLKPAIAASEDEISSGYPTPQPSSTRTDYSTQPPSPHF